MKKALIKLKKKIRLYLESFISTRSLSLLQKKKNLILQIENLKNKSNLDDEKKLSI